MGAPYDYAAQLGQAFSLPQPQEGAAVLQGVQNAIQMRYGQMQMAYQQHELQRQLGLQQQQDTAQAQALANPTPENIVKWSVASPDQWQAAKTSHDALNTDTQRQNVQDAASVYGYLQSGNTDGAAKIVQQRVDSGQTNLQPLLGMIQSGDPAKVKAAQGVAGAQLAAWMGPEQFSAAYGQLGSEARATAEEPGKIAQQGAQTNLTQAQATEARAQAEAALHPPAKTAVVEGQTDASGNPIFYNPNGAPPATPPPADLTSWAAKMDAAENGTGNPGTKNPNSSATGNGQFLNGTWLQMVKATRPDLAAGQTDDQILAMRANPQLSQQVTAAYAQVNGHALQAAGMPVNGATLALAHRLGADGAQAVLAADPKAQMSAILPKKVIAANPDLRGVTAGDYAQHLATQFGTGPISIGTDASNTAALTGDAFLRTLPASRAILIRSIANGDTPMPTGRSGTVEAVGPSALLLRQVLQYDPSASVINLQSRQATRTDFTSGESAKAINSLNTVTGHLVGLSAAIDQLNNTPFDLVNGPAQLAGQTFGNKSTQRAVANFNFYKMAVANELTKVFRGSAGAEADIQAWEKQLNSADSPTELHATVQSMVHGMMSRLQSLGAQYSQGMGKTVQPLQLVTPQTARSLQKLAAGSGDAGTPTVAVNPSTGQRLVYDPTSRQWKPA